LVGSGLAVNKGLFTPVLFLVARGGLAEEPGFMGPFEGDGAAVPATPVDDRVLAVLQQRGIDPANGCSDTVFVRRVYLDVIGTLPEPAAVLAFLDDSTPDKRARLIDDLLTREEFAEYWALKWGDLLRVKAEFPINLWPNAVQAYHRWIRDALRQNRPYDQFVRELLTSSGSNFRDPAANFYRAVQGREPAAIAEAVALNFMGVRLEHWPAERRRALAAFFKRVAYKTTAEWKEEIVYLQPGSTKPARAVLPDGTNVRISPNEDPRKAFADWLVAPGNRWFARNIVNRVWAWLMGRGIIHEPDDIRPDNPPVNAELLAHLERELVESKYDLRHIYRLILNSRTYQQSAIPQSTDADAERLFACYAVRRLDAEVLIDAFCWIGGTGERYTSAIPEPATYIPEDQRSIDLADGSVTSEFLELFGRPARDTGLESERNNQPSDAQRLYLLNASDVQKKIDRSPRLRKVLETAGKDQREAIRGMYLTILSRYPTEAEVESAQAYARSSELKWREAAKDLAWALVNTKEFLYRH
jgi:hypothetical protein